MSFLPEDPFKKSRFFRLTQGPPTYEDDEASEEEADPDAGYHWDVLEN